MLGNVKYTQIRGSRMKKTLKEKDLPEPWFGKRAKAVPAPKNTRAASKLLALEETVAEDVAKEPSAKGRGREKGKKVESAAGKGQKNGKKISTATADVVLGRSKSAVPNQEELRRKRIEDAVACGRVVKTISNPAMRKTCPTMARCDTSEEKMDEDMEAADAEHNSQYSTEVAGIPLPARKNHLAILPILLHSHMNV